MDRDYFLIPFLSLFAIFLPFVYHSFRFMTKYLLQFGLGTVFYLIFGWLIFDVLLGTYTETNTTNIQGFKKTEAEFNFGWLVISCAAYSALLTYVIAYLLDMKNLSRGFWISSIMGTLVASMTDTYWYASSNFYSNGYVVVLDILGASLSVGATGLVITWINRMWPKSKNVKT